VTWATPLLSLIFAFLVVGLLLVINLLNKFEVCSFTRSRDDEGSQNFGKSVSYVTYVMPLLSQNCTICVKFNLFNTVVKFSDDSFTCHREIGSTLKRCPLA